MRNQHRNQKNNNGQGKRKSYGQTTSNHNGCNRSDQNSKRKDGTLGNDGKGEVRTDVPSSSSPPQRKRRRIMMSGLGLDMIRNHLEIGQGNTKANGTRKNNDLFGNSLPRNDQKQRRGRVQRQENASSTRSDRQQNKAIKLKKEEINAKPKEAKKGNDGIKSIGSKKTAEPTIQKSSTMKNQRTKTMIPSSIQQLNSFLTSSETKPMTKNYVQLHSKLPPDEKKIDCRPLVHEKSIKSLSKESKECCEPEAVVKAKSPTVEANTTKNSLDRKRPMPSESKDKEKKANAIQKEVHSSTSDANITKDSRDRKRSMPSELKHEDKKATAIQEAKSTTLDANITKDSLDRKRPMSSESKDKDKKANAMQKEVQSSTSDANITRDSLDRKRPMLSEPKDNIKSTIKSKRQRMSFSNTEQNIPESSGSLEERVLENIVQDNEKLSNTSMMEESIGMHTSSCSMKSSPSQSYDDLKSTHSSCNILKNEKLHTKSTESEKKTHLSRVEQKVETSNNKSETSNINVNDSDIANTSKNSIDEKLAIVQEKYDTCQEQYEDIPPTKSKDDVMNPKQVSMRDIDQDRPKGTTQVQISPYRMDIWTFSNEKGETHMLSNELYLMMHIQKQYPRIPLHKKLLMKFLVESDVTSEDSVQKSVSSVQHMILILIDMMGFDLEKRNENICLRPRKEKPKESASGLKDHIDFRLELIRSSRQSCDLMGELALAYRLAAFFLFRYQYTKNSKTDFNASKARNRAFLTMLVSLRKIYKFLMGINSGDEVGKNIRDYFGIHDGHKSSKQVTMTPAIELVFDITTLLTESENGHGLSDKGRQSELLETMLKLDKSFKAEHGGLMELLFWQMLENDKKWFNQSDQRKKNQLQKITSRKENLSGGLASVLPNPSVECFRALETIISLRIEQRNQIEILSKIVSSSPTMSRAQRIGSPSSKFRYDDFAREQDNMKLIIKGCQLLSKLLDVHISSVTSNDSNKIHAARSTEQLGLYLLHFLLENDPFPQSTGDHQIHPMSTLNESNLMCTCLASILLASKAVDSPISLRRLVNYSKVPSVVGDTKNTKPISVNLLKTYERHLMNAHAYDIPGISSLPISQVEEISEMYNLQANDRVKFRQVFRHAAYQYSPCCLIENPFLVALAVFHFGCNHLELMRVPSVTNILDIEEQKLVETISDHMKAVHLFSQTEKSNVDGTSPSRTPTLGEESILSLTALVDQLNFITT